MKKLFSIEEILNVTGGELVFPGQFKSVGGISIDSRSIKAGDCFIAIKGAHFDGSDFINDAVLKGASLVVANAKPAASPGAAAFIVVRDPVRALGDIAAFHRKRFNVPTVAITGSNGKSTTKQMTAAAIGSLGRILKTEGNFNNLIGLPLTVLKWTHKDDAAVLEMGMNAPGEIARLTEIADPDVGLITNVSSAHLEFLHSVENVAKAKGELFRGMRSDKVIVVNLEDSWVVKMAEGYRGRVYTFGMQNDADVRFGRMESRSLESIDMTVYIDGKEWMVHLPVPGTHNVMNAMGALAVARALGVPTNDAIRGIESFKPMPMRMERIQLSKGIQIVNDSYNANPKSVVEALRTVSGAKRAGRFVAVLGDMLELGKDSAKCHEEVGEAVAQYKVDRLFVFGERAGDLAAGAKKSGMDSGKITIHKEIDRLKEEILDFIRTGDIVLVKGSRGMKMERVVEFLKDEIGVE